MMGEKIKLVKQSLKVLLELMGEKDKLGFVLFNHEAKKLLDLTYTTSENKKYILKLIDSIYSSGGTYILGGLKIAIDMLKSSSEEQKSNSNKLISSSIILLSDGMDNRMNNEEIGKGIRDMTKNFNSVFSLHTFGYDNDHAPKIMNTLQQFEMVAFIMFKNIKKSQNISLTF